MKFIDMWKEKRDKIKCDKNVFLIKNKKKNVEKVEL